VDSGLLTWHTTSGIVIGPVTARKASIQVEPRLPSKRPLKEVPLCRECRARVKWEVVIIEVPSLASAE
jgi:hypothetical protein